MQKFDPVTLEIIWGRLLNVSDEMSVTLLRTAFSIVVGAAHDFGCELLDADGGSLAYSYRSMPIFNITLPNVTREILKKFPRETIRPGDVFATNDPWLCAGHLPDMAMVTPAFHKGKIIGFAGNIAHLSDMSGVQEASHNVREVYEEGLNIPLCRVYEAGKRNDLLFEIISTNVRVPELVIGDIEAQITANEVGARRMVELLEEYGLPDFRALAREVQGRSEMAMRRAISALPDGDYRGKVTTDGLEEPIELAVTVSIRGDLLKIDYTGTAPQVDHGALNCTFSFTKGETLTVLKTLLTPTIPNNEGCFRPIEVSAPEGCILNARFPACVGRRPKIGWHVFGLIQDALHEVLPGRLQSASGFISSFKVYGTEMDGKVFNVHLMFGAGRGAGRTIDGISGWIFGSSASNVPVEVFEIASPMIVLEKTMATDSGGAGEHRGGPGIRTTIKMLPGHTKPVLVMILASRNVAMPKGILGGREGARTRLLRNGEPLPGDSNGAWDNLVMLEDPNDSLTIQSAGGGGAGAPLLRDRTAIAKDVLNGVVSFEGARRDYGFELPVDGLGGRS